MVPSDTGATMTTQTVSRGLSPIRAVFRNGGVVLAEQLAGVPAVAINATFFAGSVNDPDDLPGVAYLARRTIDRGTANRAAGEIAEALDDRGVSLRVAITRHAFSLSCVCLVEDFVETLELLADIARQPAFPSAEIEKRRREAITAVREDQDDPSKVAAELLLEALYGPRHPYGRCVKGTVQGLERIQRADLVRFHERCLVPSALRLAIVGDIPEPSILSAAALAFEDWRGPIAADVAIPPPADRHARTLRLESMPGKSQADISYGFTTIRRLDPRYYAYSLMNHVLGQFGLGGRLADNIRERQGMAYYAYSTIDPTIGQGPLVIRAGVDPNNVDRAIEAIDCEVRLLRDRGPAAEELEESRESLIGSIPRMLETHEGVAEFLLYVEQFGLGLDYDRRLPGLLREVTMSDVRESASDVLDPDRAAVAVAGPMA